MHQQTSNLSQYQHCRSVAMKVIQPTSNSATRTAASLTEINYSKFVPPKRAGRTDVQGALGNSPLWAKLHQLLHQPRSHSTTPVQCAAH